MVYVMVQCPKSGALLRCFGFFLHMCSLEMSLGFVSLHTQNWRAPFSEILPSSQGPTVFSLGVGGACEGPLGVPEAREGKISNEYFSYS